MKKLILAGALCVAFPFGAHAGSPLVSVDVHASTLGVGIGVAMPITEEISGRLSLSKFNYASQITTDASKPEETKHDYDVKLLNLAALADWHLFNGITHLTGGVIFNNNKFDVVSTPKALMGTGTVITTVTFNKIAPYLGFGWSGRASKTGFSFRSDIGIMFQGAGTSTVTLTGSAGAGDSIAAKKAVDAELEKYKIYPVISVGLAYAF